MQLRSQIALTMGFETMPDCADYVDLERAPFLFALSFYTSFIRKNDWLVNNDG